MTPPPTTPKISSSSPSDVFSQKRFVIKRDGTKQEVDFKKIDARIQKLCRGLLVDPSIITQKTIAGLHPGVKTSDLDELAAETASALISTHPDYDTLAMRIAVSDFHKNTRDVETFGDYIKFFQNIKPFYYLSEELVRVYEKYADRIQAAINYERDYLFDYFGFRTLKKSYLLGNGTRIIERPQHMWMRVAIGIHGMGIKGCEGTSVNGLNKGCEGTIDDIINTYNSLSLLKYIHGSPTLFNCGTPKAQMSSCFITPINDDSMKGIYKTLTDCAFISQNAGGLGISVSNIRHNGAAINGVANSAKGVPALATLFNSTAKYCDQRNKRKGAIAFYLEIWHADILEFLQLKKNTGKEEKRARDLFYGLWVSDLFMERLEQKGDWSLFCPHTSPGLDEVYSDEFNRLYLQYESEGRAIKVVKAQVVWEAIQESLAETGLPYMCFKDSVNKKSNHKNLGIIKSSNLCTEVMQFHDKNEIAVCNLASINLKSLYVPYTDPRYEELGKKFGIYGVDFEELYWIVHMITYNLNKVIDRTFYPVDEARNSNLKYRPIGIGIQGLADLFMLLRIPFTSDLARLINKAIAEVKYYAALDASCKLAQKTKTTYTGFIGSPLSEGKFHFDLWNEFPTSSSTAKASPSGICDVWGGFNELRERIKKFGVLNSLFIAPMPTATTAQILGNTECFEPIHTNMYSRRVLAGDFTVINRYLVNDLIKLDLWKPHICDAIKACDGSIQTIDEIPLEIKEIYKTVWEIKMKLYLQMAAERAPWIDQSQSLNYYFASTDPQFTNKLSTLLKDAHRMGLKGVYYCRSTAPTKADKVSVAVNESISNPTTMITTIKEEEEEEVLVCSRDNPNCTSCSS